MNYKRLQLLITVDAEYLTVRNKIDSKVWVHVARSRIDHLLQETNDLVQANNVSHLRVLGSDLYQHVIDTEYWQKLLQACRASNSTLLLELAVAPELAALPWESLYNGNDFLVSDQDVNIIIRRVIPDVNPRPLEVKAPPLRMLLTTYAVDSEGQESCKSTEQALRDFVNKTRGVVELTVLRQPNPATLHSTMLNKQRRQCPFHIWHHHGPGDAQQIMLQETALPWSTVADAFEKFSDLRIMTFQLQYTDGVAKEIVARWQELPVPVIAGFNRNVSIAPLQVFETFYQQVMLDDVSQAISQTQKTIREAAFMDATAWQSFIVITNTLDQSILVPPERKTIAGVDAMSARNEVFVSYAHKDAEWLDKLLVHLKPLQRQNLIKVWSDKNIETGDLWRDDIEDAMSRARVAVLLVSPDFLASDFIADNELPPILDAAREDGLRIFWIPIRASVYQTSIIRHYQSAHNPTKPLNMLSEGEVDQVLAKIAMDIAKILS